MEEQILKFSQLSLLISAKGDKDDTITCSLLDKRKNIIFGTAHGRIAKIDANGNILQDYPRFQTTVTCMSMTEDCNYLLVCDKNGNVQILSLISNSVILSTKHSILVTKCALDPSFNEKGSPKFFIADLSGSIYKYSPGFFFRQNFSKVIEPQQRIQGLLWHKNYLFYTTNEKLVAMNVEDEKTNLYECFPPFQKKNAEHLCTFLVLSDKKVGVCFGNYFYELSLDKKRSVFFNIQHDIYSLVYTKNNTTIYVYPTKTGAQSVFIDQNCTTNTITPPSPDPIVDVYAIDNDRFLFIYPRSVFTAVFTSWEERVKSMLYPCTDDECFNYLKKWIETVDSKEKSHLIVAVCQHLFTRNSIQLAAKCCVDFLEENDDWTEAISLFQTSNALQKLAEYIPINVLKKSTKTGDVLLILLEYFPMRFLQVFVELPPESFDPSVLKEPLKAKATKDVLFNIPLMHVYHRMNEHTLAFDCGVTAKYLKLFEDIAFYKRYEYPLDRFERLYKTYGALFTDFLISARNDLLPAIVLLKFGKRRDDMLDYMHKLVTLDVPIPDSFRTDLAILYIEHHHPATMHFLQLGQFFDYGKARAAALKEKMWREAAFLSRKTGAVTEGMKIQLENVKDPEASVQYAMQAEHERVWNMLKEAAYKDSELLSYMLDNLPSLHIDSVDFVRHIPAQMAEKIDLASSSAKTIKEFKRRLAAVQLTQGIVSNAAFDRFNSQLSNAKKAKILRK